MIAALASGCPGSNARDSDGGAPDAGQPADAGGDDQSDASLDASVIETRDAGVGDSGTSDAGASDAGPAPLVAWVLSSFGNNQDLPNDSLHLSYSVDGLKWIELNAGQPVYQLSGHGTNHIRDPFIVRKLDGTFVYIATDWTLAENDSNYWNRPSGKLVMADSTDLITFTNPRLVPVTTLSGPSSSAMHAWAPEVFYDPERAQYAILWSGNDTSNRNRIYVSYTTDFQAVSDPANPIVYFDPGYTVIDASPLLPLGSTRNYLFFKDESASDIQVARSPSTSMAPGVFARISPEYLTRGAQQTVSQGVEGPFALKAPGQNVWYLYADRYSSGGAFGGWKTTSLDVAPSSWTAMSSTEYSFPPNVRHANVVRVTQAQLDALISHYGATRITRIKTGYSENNAPFYVAHSWFHLMITPLADTAHGQVSNDFRWRVVPGLADPTDPALVSLAPAGYPTRYVRINSQDPGLYPACTSGSPPNAANRGTELCGVPANLKNHLAWADELVDSAAFRSDATFRKVPALNGDSTMVSLQWYVDSTRYLRHMDYQIFATPLSPAPSTDAPEASFKLEQE